MGYNHLALVCVCVCVCVCVGELCLSWCVCVCELAKCHITTNCNLTNCPAARTFFALQRRLANLCQPIPDERQLLKWEFRRVVLSAYWIVLVCEGSFLNWLNYFVMFITRPRYTPTHTSHTDIHITHTHTQYKHYTHTHTHTHTHTSHTDIHITHTHSTHITHTHKHSDAGHESADYRLDPER